MSRLLGVELTDFRNYRNVDFHPSDTLSVVCGPNGSGKTNLLEAISLLAPGQGMRRARLDAIARFGSAGFAVAARIETPDGERRLGTGTQGDETAAGRRAFRLDGEPARSQAEIASLLPLVWLTPQMERLFGEPASGRRRFLDRLALALEPAHARILGAHERALATRRRLLADRPHETGWIAAAEDQVARHAVAATAIRVALCRRLDDAAIAAPGFPRPRLRLTGELADALDADPARIVEDRLRERLAACRGIDRASGTASAGAHRADVAIEDRDSGLAANDASTGQQKAMLLGIMLAHARLIADERGAAPLLLLDEPLVHLDARRRAALFEHLRDGGAQAVLTGTDPDPFIPLGNAARRFRADGISLTETAAPE